MLRRYLTTTTARDRLKDAIMFTIFALFASILLTGGVSDPTGLQPDGTWRVVDYDSHVAMCLDPSFAGNQDACLTEARNAWR